MKLQLPIETANQILGYLSTRPYQEVYLLIQAMQDAARPPADLPIVPPADGQKVE